MRKKLAQSFDFQRSNFASFDSGVIGTLASRQLPRSHHTALALCGIVRCRPNDINTPTGGVLPLYFVPQIGP